MRLTKISRSGGKTYVVIRSEDGLANADVVSNKSGTAFTIAPEILEQQKSDCCTKVWEGTQAG